VSNVCMPIARTLFAVVLFVSAAFAQVSVTVETSKTQYLQGEPIIVLIAVENIGSEAVPYSSGCDFDIKLLVEHEQTEPAFQQYGCFRGYGWGGGCSGVDHPPRLQSAESITFKRLLNGYRLDPGNYILKATGNAPLVGKVEGNHFSRKFEIQVLPGTEQELKAAFAPFVKAARGKEPDHMSYKELTRFSEEKVLARRAIAENAAPFLEDVIKSFWNDRGDEYLAIGGLARINSDSSRAALVEFFNHSSDPDIRRTIAHSLANIGHPDQFEFFAGLLAETNPAPDARIQSSAIEGLGRIGGWRVVQVLEQFQTDNVELNSDVAYALGVTGSPDAVPALIEFNDLGGAHDSICSSLATLTRRQWCDGTGADLRNAWRDWWQQHQSDIEIQRPGNCNGAMDAKSIK